MESIGMGQSSAFMAFSDGRAQRNKGLEATLHAQAVSLVSKLFCF